MRFKASGSMPLPVSATSSSSMLRSWSSRRRRCPGAAVGRPVDRADRRSGGRGLGKRAVGHSGGRAGIRSLGRAGVRAHVVGARENGERPSGRRSQWGRPQPLGPPEEPMGATRVRRNPWGPRARDVAGAHRVAATHRVAGGQVAAGQRVAQKHEIARSLRGRHSSVGTSRAPSRRRALIFADRCTTPQGSRPLRGLAKHEAHSRRRGRDNGRMSAGTRG